MMELVKSGARSYLRRTLGVFLGIPVGWILVIGAVVALFRNEGRTVKVERTLGEARTNFVSIGPGEINPAADGRLVHVQGHVSTGETLRDPVFEVSAQVLRLKRLVETFQWRERSREVTEQSASGPRKRTSYDYEQVWAARRIDSSKFKQLSGHENPPAAPFPCADWEAKQFHLGAFTLQKTLRDELKGYEPFGIRVGEPPAQVRQLGFRPLIASFYFGNDPMSPQIGDVRVVYEAVQPQDVSIIAGQQRATLGPYQTRSGGTVSMLNRGSKSAAEMFHDALWWNTVLKWLWRIGGFIALWLGYNLALGPLTALSRMLPGLLGGLALATGFATFFLAVAVTLVTTSIAWLAYRPKYGLPMLAGGIVLMLAIGWWGNRKREGHTAAA